MAYCVFGIVIAAICRFGYNIVMEANLNIATCTSVGTVCRNFFSIIVDWN